MEQKKGLNREERILLGINTLYAISVTLSNTFLNVYLWKIKNDFSAIAIFNLSLFITMPIAFYFGGRLTRKRDRLIALRLGILLQAFFYLAILFLKEKVKGIIIPVGIMQGLGAGFYWFSYNMIYFEVTGPVSRDRYNGMNGVLSSVVGMIAPLLSGGLISKMPGMKGYTWLFLTSFLLFLAATLVTFLLQKRAMKGDGNLAEAWKEALLGGEWGKVMRAHLFQGFREGVLLFLMGLLVFLATKSEWMLGIYTFLTYFFSFISYSLVGKWAVPGRRSLLMLLSVIGLVLLAIPIQYRFQTVTIFLLGIGGAIFYPLFIIPITSTTFDVLGKDEKRVSLRGEYIIVREFFLTFGRVAGILLFLLLLQTRRSDLSVAIPYILLLNGMILFSWYFLRKVHTTLWMKGA